MAHSQPMLDTYPRDFNLDSRRLADTIETLIDYANTCTQCADACLSEANAAELATCIRLNLDGADVCSAASRVISRQTDYDANVSRPLVDACIAVCRRCEEACQTLLSAMR